MNACDRSGALIAHLSKTAGLHFGGTLRGLVERADETPVSR